MNADTGELYGSIIAGLTVLGKGYIISATELFSDIYSKASLGIIDFLPRTSDFLRLYPSLDTLNANVTLSHNTQYRTTQKLLREGIDGSGDHLRAGETSSASKGLGKDAALYTSSASSSKAQPVEMEPTKAEDRLKARKRTKTGCLSKLVSRFIEFVTG